MELEARKLLEDIRLAADRITSFIAGESLDTFRANELLRSAVERQFEIIGEALHRLERFSPAIAARISDYRRIIAFRNILIHGYDIIDVEVVWDAASIKLSVLKQQVEELAQSS